MEDVNVPVGNAINCLQRGCRCHGRCYILSRTREHLPHSLLLKLWHLNRYGGLIAVRVLHLKDRFRSRYTTRADRFSDTQTIAERVQEPLCAEGQPLLQRCKPQQVML